MKKIIITYGLIAGAIVSTLLLASMPLWEQGILNFKNGEVVGYTTMVVALSLIFFGIKSYRDNYANGTITFGKGVKIGILITLIASVMYVIAWEICLATVAHDFMNQMSAAYLEEKRSAGATQIELLAAQKEMTQMAVLYKNPLIRFGFTLIEILPIGIVITLISAALLRRKEFMPAVEVQSRVE